MKYFIAALNTNFKISITNAIIVMKTPSKMSEAGSNKLSEKIVECLVEILF